MKRQAKIFSLILTILLTIIPALAKDDCKTNSVEVTEVKELGLSDADETKSVIEVKWCINEKHKSSTSNFNVTVEVTYADGAVLIFDEQSASRSRSTRIEVPALHTFRGKKPAIIKQIKAFVTTD